MLSVGNGSTFDVCKCPVASHDAQLFLTCVLSKPVMCDFYVALGVVSGWIVLSLLMLHCYFKYFKYILSFLNEHKTCKILCKPKASFSPYRRGVVCFLQPSTLQVSLDHLPSRPLWGWKRLIVLRFENLQFTVQHVPAGPATERERTTAPLLIWKHIRMLTRQTCSASQ